MSIKLLARVASDSSTLTFLEPSSMTITRTYDTPAVMLEITFPYRGTVPDLTDIQVNHGSDILFRGYCDELIRSVDDEGYFVTINARSPGCLLSDNEAPPASYSNLTAQAYFNAELAPLGFSSLTLPNTTASAASFQVNKGHSVWEAFTQLCFRLYGREPHITENMGIVVETLSAVPVLEICNDPARDSARYCSLAYITRRSSAISKIISRDSSGSYSQTLQNPFGNPLLVNRRRYVIPAAEFCSAQNLDAYQRILHGQRGIHSVQATLPKLYNLQPGQAVGLRTTQTDVQILNVYQSKIIYNYAGCRTRLVLANPVYL